MSEEQKYNLILASASPRRKELLRRGGFVYEICVSSCEEKTEETVPAKVVEALSAAKAADVYAKMHDKRQNPLVLAADTVVAVDGEILGKPVDDMDAYRMLSLLSGKTHEVYTGVTLRWGEDKIHTFHEVTKVTVAELSEEEIRGYIKSGQATDKAGAYGIQTGFATYISGIEGDYNNVVGLPLAAVYHTMKELGLSVERDRRNVAADAETTLERPTRADIRKQIDPQVKQLIGFGLIFGSFLLLALLILVIWIMPGAIHGYQKAFLVLIAICVVVSTYLWVSKKMK